MEQLSNADPTPVQILVVDDEPTVLKTISSILKRAGYECASAASAAEARDVMRGRSFDLVLTDMNMPGDSGLDLLVEIGHESPRIAAMMVTGEDSTDLAQKALDLGAYGYVIKPFQRNELLINVANALRRRRLEIENRAHRDRLEEMVRERTSELWEALQTVERREQDLRVTREETIERLSIAAEFRDDETAAHLNRMSRYCELLAGWSGYDNERSERIRVASIMHDVGKIGIPDRILLKPGSLTAEEYGLMQEHAEFGYRILTGTTSDLLDQAAVIALAHHEKWDGSGYPSGASGESIPEEGRIAAVADVFDALTTNRVYRRAFDLPEAVRIMQEGRGAHFEPRLLDVFLDHLPEVLEAKQEADAAGTFALSQAAPRRT